MNNNLKGKSPSLQTPYKMHGAVKKPVNGYRCPNADGIGGEGAEMPAFSLPENPNSHCEHILPRADLHPRENIVSSESEPFGGEPYEAVQNALPSVPEKIHSTPSKRLVFKTLQQHFVPPVAKKREHG